MGAATFQYQVWPLDTSSAWYTFFRTLLLQGPITRNMSDISVESEVVVGTDQICGVVVQMKHDELAEEVDSLLFSVYDQNSAKTKK
jgi:hypothetical protein